MNWSTPDSAYLLGVIHGDGHLGNRSIEISVGYKDQEYADIMTQLLISLGFRPKVYRQRSALRIDVHSVALRRELGPLKIKGTWSWPEDLNIPHYIAGVFDTDGYVGVAQTKRIGITLKRSGNLARLAQYLSAAGVGEFRARDTVSSFKGKLYETETITICGMDRVLRFISTVTLRNPRKLERCRLMRQHILELKADIPLWLKVAEWCELEPRTWKEISCQFGMTKAQVDSVLGNIKAYRTVTVIPPPEALSRYSVKNL